MSAVIEARNLSHRFGEQEVLQPINLKIEEGDFVALLGPSGCGKSTFLRLVAGLLPVTAGELNVKHRSPGEIAFVFQDAHLLPWRRVTENISLPHEMLSTNPKLIKERVGESLELVGLTDFAEAYPHQLSGGMKMRVSLARALVTHPKLLLLDEPFAALDEVTRTHLDEELRQIWKKTGITILFVTHSLLEASFLANRLLVFSPRPAQIIWDKQTPLGDVRNRSLKTDATFISLLNELTDVFERGSHS
jgi:NitT/TauT family transport system ATP-binding protein